uniref:Transposase Tc1-like domain-containing protein n=1 Tax=Salmo trutta TaxID=8032 RepID=A0A673VW62_SALTR
MLSRAFLTNYLFFSISKCLKVPRSSVQTIVRKYKHHGTTQSPYCSGRRCVLNSGPISTKCPQSSHIHKVSTKLPYPQSVHKAPISTKTVLRELHEMGFHGRAAAHKPKFTMFCRHLTLEQWKRVLWSDESPTDESGFGRCQENATRPNA